MIGVILGGGNATRLGALGSQLNKTCIAIGQQPAVVHHLLNLEAVGAVQTVIVVGPDNVRQVRAVLGRAGLERRTNVVVQDEPLGPAHALWCALDSLDLDDELTPAIITASDTLLARHELHLPVDSVAVARPPSYDRSWCWTAQEDQYTDGVCRQEDDVRVFVGAMRVSDAQHLRDVCANLQPGAGMAPVLTDYRCLRQMEVSTWQDVGDIPALAAAQRQRFIARSFNGLTLNDCGVLTKSGADLRDEALALAHPPVTARHLFPRVYDINLDGSSYSMEHVDLPSMAELWLYWPGDHRVWEHATTTLVHQLQAYLHPGVTAPRDVIARAERMYLEKLATRSAKFKWPATWERAQASHIVAVLREKALPPIVYSADRHAALIHGDPNFTNVLWSMRTDTVKLLDPRGNWGGPGSLGDARYDWAKIAISPYFTAIAHGLFGLRSDGLTLWPRRVSETEAVFDAIIEQTGMARSELHTLVVYLLLTAAPLHEEYEGIALIWAARHHYDQYLARYYPEGAASSVIQAAS